MPAQPENLAACRAALVAPLRQATLCFLVRDRQVLLAMKKRGFGRGKWNGVGGKPEPGESIADAAIREAREEIGVTPLALRRVATLNFYFPRIPEYAGWNQQVCVYLADAWDGEPVETEEMAPRWFDLDRLPLEVMWPDDAYWLGRVLAGERLSAHFLYKNAREIAEWEIVPAPPLPGDVGLIIAG